MTIADHLATFYIQRLKKLIIHPAKTLRFSCTGGTNPPLALSLSFMNLVKVDKAFLSIIRLFLSVSYKYKKYKFYILKFLDSRPDL